MAPAARRAASSWAPVRTPAATEAPAAGPATTDPLATAEATPGEIAAPGTPAAGTPIELPESITGQPADQQTCSVGFFG